MKKFIALAVALAMATSVGMPSPAANPGQMAADPAVSAADTAQLAAAPTAPDAGIGALSDFDRSKLPRLIISTDLEVDDTNGILLTLMFADQYDIAGLVWSAGMFHWSGDGVHTLEEITPNYLCPPIDSGTYKSYRPVEPGLLDRLISENYAADYVYLSQNNRYLKPIQNWTNICKSIHF